MMNSGVSLGSKEASEFKTDVG